jgi:hypothetical protein
VLTSKISGCGALTLAIDLFRMPSRSCATTPQITDPKEEN